MKTIKLFLLVCFAFCAANIEAQSKRHKKVTIKSAKTVKVKNAKKVLKTISAGVINGRAIDLVKPEYPESARAVNIYGQVAVRVLIDENGSVVAAKADSGHLFLRPASVKAAMQSKFEPVTLSGEPVRVNGIITYNFILSEWNWLEIGYALNYDSHYYSIKILLETFPPGYQEERQLLTQLFEANENEDRINESVVASIRGKLIDNAKASWLFEVGLSLAKARQEWNAGSESEPDKNSQNFQNLKLHVQNPPSGVKEALLEKMKRLIFFIDGGETSRAFSDLQRLEEIFPYVGR